MLPDDQSPRISVARQGQFAKWPLERIRPNLSDHIHDTRSRTSVRAMGNGVGGHPRLLDTLDLAQFASALLGADAGPLAWPC